MIETSRSLSYLAFATAFTYPDQEVLQAIRGGELAGALQRLLGAVDPALVADVDWKALGSAVPDDDTLLVEFTRLFEAGANGPDCPLNGAHHQGRKTDLHEELVRFYDFFGLSLDHATQGEPDHLLTELEFLHFLAFQEAQLGAAGEDVGALLRAQRDFIERHPGAWVPALREQLAKHDAPRIFCELARLLERFLEFELIRLRRQTGGESIAH
ncbi:MAG: molecular chaperone TorD family protein [Pseudomonadales bacterium]|nr:molecular chaperone TorD family protein [Pseudomonadales bacterium]